LGGLIKNLSRGKECPLEKLFQLIHLKLLEFIATYPALAVIKLEVGGVPRAGDGPSLQRLQVVGAIPECFGYSEWTCPLGRASARHASRTLPDKASIGCSKVHHLCDIAYPNGTLPTVAPCMFWLRKHRHQRMSTLEIPSLIGELSPQPKHPSRPMLVHQSPHWSCTLELTPLGLHQLQSELVGRSGDVLPTAISSYMIANRQNRR